MQDLQIKKSFKEEFRKKPEFYGKMMSVFDKYRCTIKPGDDDIGPLKIFPYFCQMWDGQPETIIEEDFICAVLWQRIIQGKIQYRIQESPQCFKDDMIKENQSLVKSYITHCLSSEIEDADFWGGTQGEDGFVKFKNAPIHKEINFPLEIGYIKPSQFYYHIYYKHCIARLPYDCDYIIYFEDLEIGNFVYSK